MVEMNPTGLPELSKPSRDLLELREAKVLGTKFFRETKIRYISSLNFLLRAYTPVRCGAVHTHKGPLADDRTRSTARQPDTVGGSLHLHRTPKESSS